MAKPLWIDGILGSQLRDTQGETLSVEGADISELEAGRGRWNDNHGKGFFNCIGRITYGKKIFKSEDCENERQRYYWEKIKAPYIYGKGFLFNDEDHPNAKACAAILRNMHKSDCPLKLKLSVEGGVVARGISDSSLLARTKIHSCAITFVPANQATLVEPLNLDKSSDVEADMLLIKSVMHLAQTSVPSFRHITRDASAARVEQNINKIMEMMGEDEEFVGLKKALVQESLELKIEQNVRKIHELVKAIPGPEEDYYHVKDGYTGKDAKKAQIHAVKEMVRFHGKWHKPFKTMTNEDTGKPELHMMVHRGLSGPPDRNPPPEATNQFHVTKSHIIQPKHAVHAMSYDAANEYTSDHPESGVYSAWVPVSHIEATARYMGARFKNPNMPDASWMTHDFDRDAEIQSSHADNQGHITVKPGKYQRVTRAEMQEMDDRFRKNLKSASLSAITDPSKAIEGYNYRWMSRGGTLRGIPSEPLNRTPMDKKIKHRFPDDEPDDTDMSKALTAGYGGAGSPTNLVGGGVMQSESLDAPKSLRYITCDDCGKEQVYGKFQVKCRDCGKTFSLTKLEKFFRTKG